MPDAILFGVCLLQRGTRKFSLANNSLVGTVPDALTQFGTTAFDLNCFCIGLYQLQSWCSFFSTDPRQLDALVALFSSTNGSTWGNSSGWLVGDPYQNHWFGLEWSGIEGNGQVGSSAPCLASVRLAAHILYLDARNAQWRCWYRLACPSLACNNHFQLALCWQLAVHTIRGRGRSLRLHVCLVFQNSRQRTESEELLSHMA